MGGLLWPPAARRPSRAVHPAAASVATTSGGGIGTTGWVLIGAGAVGMTTAIIRASDDDEGPASPSQ